MPIAATVPGEGDIVAETLPGGLVAMTTHAGPYDTLTEAHAAIQVWIEKQGLALAVFGAALAALGAPRPQ